MYCLNLLEMALVLAEHDRTYEDLATKFLEHSTYIANAMDRCGLWSDEDGFHYDVPQVPGSEPVPLRVRSMVGLLPLAATATLTNDTLRRLPDFASHFEWFRVNKPQHAGNVVHNDVNSSDGWLLRSSRPNASREPSTRRSMTTSRAPGSSEGTPTGEARSGPAQLPTDRGAPPIRSLHRRRLHDRLPERRR